MGVETVMVDWDKVLTPEALGLQGKIDRVIWEERTTLDDRPYLRAMVVLPPGIPDDKLTWEMAGPIHQRVWDAIAAQIEVGHPHVLFITFEDQEAADRGDFYDQDDEDDDDVAA